MSNMMIGTCTFDWQGPSGAEPDASTTFIAYNGKYYPTDARGLQALGCDLSHQGHLVAVGDDATVTFRSKDEARLSEEQEEQLFARLYEQLCQKYGIQLSRGQSGDALNSVANTPKFIAEQTVRAINLALQEKPSALVRVWRKCEGQFDRIDHLFQKARLFGYAFRIRRILMISMLACAVIATGLVPVLVTVPLVRCMVRREQKADLMITNVIQKNAERIIQIETTRRCGIMQRDLMFQIGPEMYGVERGRKEWLKLFRTIVCDHSGHVQLSQNSHQIRTYNGYLAFVQAMMGRMKAQSSPRDFNAMLCEMPTYSQAIPAYARV